jgi:hypothetical protein
MQVHHWSGTMRDSRRPDEHTYRLILQDDGRGVARIIEFEAHGPKAALNLAAGQCPGRGAELLEDGRSLGRLRNDRRGGFWVIAGAGNESGPTRAATAPMGGASIPAYGMAQSK